MNDCEDAHARARRRGKGRLLLLGGLILFAIAKRRQRMRAFERAWELPEFGPGFGPRWHRHHATEEATRA